MPDTEVRMELKAQELDKLAETYHEFACSLEKAAGVLRTMADNERLKADMREAKKIMREFV